MIKFFKEMGRTARIATVSIVAVLIAGVAIYGISNSSLFPEDASASEITLEQAKTLALAEVEGATADDIVKAHEDYDDGILYYEIKIQYDGFEYEFDFDTSGKLLSKDIDRMDRDDEYGDKYDDDWDDRDGNRDDKRDDKSKKKYRYDDDDDDDRDDD